MLPSFANYLFYDKIAPKIKKDVYTLFAEGKTFSGYHLREYSVSINVLDLQTTMSFIMAVLFCKNK
jgi:hypothetical protein